MSDPKRIFYVLMGVIGLLILAGGGLFYYVDSLFGENSREISNLKADDAILDEKIRKGRALEKQLEELGFLTPVIEEVLPGDKEQSNVVGELTSIESRTGITLQNITFPGSDIGSDGVNPDLSQTENLESIGTVKILPIATSFQCVSFNQMINFLENIESNRRKMQVASIDVTRRNATNDPTCPAGNLDITLNLEAFIKP